ncbi:MAG: Holliday junction branch migration protein RuvA [Epsilonproteobacteria bacterium]|uniref:Holliday junction branch migration protein RuvA n=1 Tax=Sulfurospirillum TaxID=57665 RepID=UPI000541BB1F|nr:MULTISPECIES: Holliday junction branch migration protein RuvA [Sulfurospirillum]MDY0265956.1 Holliday junction branch migration protein RuvA [Sulfurospirillum cavolei]NCB53557.1 Holliday junction branch migration protein RuvA [Campylobacterota bacterium]KHG34220.1 MAG: ATP-dependent DNA helicase RuvA [Sulfurospirillum sp. MES]MCP3651075.1 Holliday junction branch migration protein RuvA [Sulfurospirillum sp. DNRA8]MCR1809921.1 Holliday junction branch migration protein RuvA [Sulfurospirillum
MIVGIEGKIVKKEITALHLKIASGITYKVFISLFSLGKITSDAISLHVTQIIREDQHSLYGFVDENEKKVFDTLIKLNGIGPSTALAVCSTLSPDDFTQALLSQNVHAFQKVPGIGPKSAKRILVELSDFSLHLSDEESSGGSMLEATMALESLGFKKDAIKKALGSLPSGDTQTLIKEALRKLS